MARFDPPFTEEEIAEVASPPSDEVIILALRSGTKALHEFAETVMEPMFRGALSLTDYENAVGVTFYRMLHLLRTLGVLNDARDFQTVATCARTIFELCVDVHLLCGEQLVDRAADKFHAFTRAARFYAAGDMVKFYDANPSLEHSTAKEYRRLIGNKVEGTAVLSLCQELWNRPKAPAHWSGLRWSEQVKRMPAGMQATYARRHQLLAWNAHGGAAAVGGMSSRAIFCSMEVISREIVRDTAPEALRLIAVKMHMHRAKPDFFEVLDFVVERVATWVVIDAKRVLRGYPSKFGITLSKAVTEPEV
jgi:hypothetical protein